VVVLSLQRGYVGVQRGYVESSAWLCRVHNVVVWVYSVVVSSLQVNCAGVEPTSTGAQVYMGHECMGFCPPQFSGI